MFAGGEGVMSKPIREVQIKAATGSKGSVDAVVDSGSFYTIIREDRIPPEGRWIRDEALVSPHLGSDMLIGAKTMQAWDITIKNKNGHTTVHVGRDMSDADVQTAL